MHAHVPVSLFESVVLPDIVKVIPPDDNGPLHFKLLYNTSQDTSTNGYIAGEWTLFVNVGALESLKNAFLNLDLFKKIGICKSMMINK